MKTKKIKNLLLMAGLVLVAASCSSDASKDTGKEEKIIFEPLVELSPVQQTRFTHKINVQGNVETDQDITLSAEMGGLITSINVKEGQIVRKGQVIANVDASILTSNVQELQTQLQYAEYMLGKQEELMKRGVGSEFDLETAKNQVNSLKASMNSLNTQRGKASIRAPFTGTIDQVFARKGQMAGPAAPLVRLVNNSNIDIIATVSEKHFSKIKIGTPIAVTFPYSSDDTVNLAITHVGNYIEPTNRTFRIMSKIKNNTFFLPNMLAEVSITDLDVPNGTVVPSKSILKDQDNIDYLYIATEIDSQDKKKKLYTVERVNVTVIKKYDGSALIKDNPKVKDNEQVVVAGAKGIKNKDTVRTKK